MCYKSLVCSWNSRRHVICKQSHRVFLSSFPWILAPYVNYIKIKIKNSFSPVWTLMCPLRCGACVKLFPLWSHMNGLSPVWTLIWISSLCVLMKLFPHWVQVKDLSTLFSFKNVFLVWVTVFLQFWHDVPPPGHPVVHCPRSLPSHLK